MSDRLELLKPVATPRVRKLALQRLADPTLLVNAAGKIEVKGFQPIEVKVALLLVHEMNPHETFGTGEEMLMRGIKRSETLTAAKRDKHFRPL